MSVTMQHNSVFLLNINAIIVLSLCSDYWILVKIRPIEPPPGCVLQELRQLSLLKCQNTTYALVEEHSNLMRQCNDLTEGYRQRISTSGRFYGYPCYWFIFDHHSTWRNVESDWGKDILALLSAVSCMTVIIIASKESGSRRPKNSSRLLLASAALYSVPVAVNMHVIHSTNIRNAKNESHRMIYAEAGWSLVLAILSILLMFGASYSEHKRHRHQVERRESERRRRQLHNAIMSSCRQDIAMAIRARMTVI